MKKHFYSHLISIESLNIELGKLDLSEDEKTHLLSLAESNIHHAVLDAILSELSIEDKQVFFELLDREEHEKIFHHLKNKIENIEEKIKKTAEDLAKELQKDILEVYRRDDD